MVKIRELSNTQLVSQIEKYEKIYFQLVNERDKRLEASGEDSGLLTKREIVVKEQEESQKDIQEAYQLKFDDSEIAQINEAEKAIELQEESTEDEVRVTQLLRLSKDQLAELRGHKGAKKVVKKKIKKKVNKS
jgi:hypothetical protein